MDFQYLFNSRGNWIAFRLGKYMFDSKGRWIGWTPWDDDHVVNKEGKYLGTVWEDKRLYYFEGETNRGPPGNPGPPGSPGPPGDPGPIGPSPLPPGARDV